MKRSDEKIQIAEQAVAYFAEHPDHNWTQAHQALPNHYKSAESMRRSLRELTEGRITKVPRGVITNSDQQQAIIDMGRGVAEGSPDAVTLHSNQMLGWESGGTDYESMAGAMRMGYTLRDRYLDYGVMDQYPELSAALDVTADESTVRDVQRGHVIWGTGEDALVRNVVDDLLYRRLDVEADVWATIRTLAKYGQACAEIIATSRGVVGLNYLPIVTVRKVLDEKGILQGYVQSLTGEFRNIDVETFRKLLRERTKEKGPNKDGIVVFAPHEVVWWQMPSRQVRSPYGVSILDAARWAYKRLAMLEDSVVVYLLTRSPARNAVYVDTQDMAPAQAMAYLQEVKQRFKKRRIVDPTTGQIDHRANVLSSDEDLFIPVRAGREATRVDVIAGPEYNIIDQLEFFRAKMFSALRMPKAYFGQGDDPTHSGLSTVDVMFARTIMRIQRQYMTGLLEVVRLHLALLDVDPDLTDTGLDMTVPSSILEMAQIETGNARAALATAMAEQYDKHTILTQVYGESDDEADAILRRKRQDAIDDAQTQGRAQFEMAAAMNPKTGEPTVPPEQVQIPGEEPPPQGAPEEEPEPEPAPMKVRPAETNAEEIRYALKRLEALGGQVQWMRKLHEQTNAEMRQLPRKVGRQIRSEIRGVKNEIRTNRRFK
jgi:hypothetical protein